MKVLESLRNLVLLLVGLVLVGFLAGLIVSWADLKRYLNMRKM